MQQFEWLQIFFQQILGSTGVQVKKMLSIINWIIPLKILIAFKAILTLLYLLMFLIKAIILIFFKDFFFLILKIYEPINFFPIIQFSQRNSFLNAIAQIRYTFFLYLSIFCLSFFIVLFIKSNMNVSNIQIFLHYFIISGLNRLNTFNHTLQISLVYWEIKAKNPYIHKYFLLTHTHTHTKITKNFIWDKWNKFIKKFNNKERKKKNVTILSCLGGWLKNNQV